MRTALVFVFLFSTHLMAANHFVRSGASGSNNGTSWTNAWNGFSAISWNSVSCGDTIWVAGGNYTQALNPNKKCTSSSRLYIRRARSDASAATSAAGWSSSYDSLVHQTGGNAEINFNGDYDFITISGRTTADGGSHGWLLDRRSTSGGCGICFNSSGGDDNTVEYMDMQGPGEINYSSDGRAIDCTPPSGSVNRNTFSHLKIWDWESGIYAVGCPTPTFEYIDMFDISPANWQTFHPNGIITWDARDGIVRFSKFHKGPKGRGTGEGVFFEQSGGSTGWQIYGNLFYDLNSSGLKAIQITSNVGPIRIYNNTFDNLIVPGVYVNSGSCGSGSESRNNLSYAASNGSCGTTSNNVTASSASVFVNRAAKDYRIVSTVGSGFPRNAGTNLSSVFQTDIQGNVFGADGTWDVGAYEYEGGGGNPPTPPNPPQSLSAVVQ